MLTVTFILRDLADEFFTGRPGSLRGLDNMTDAERFNELKRHAQGDMRHCVSMKIGAGQFRDAVELNRLLRGPCAFTFSIAPRRGYRLATFTVRPA